MAQKTEIQYVNRFYVFGSEAPKPAPKPKKVTIKLPELHLEKPRRIYIDPFALLGVAAAITMLCLLVVGAFRLRDTRVEYDQMKERLADLKLENASLEHTYHTSYDEDEIRSLADSQGMVDASEADGFTMFITLPEEPEEETAWDDFVWFLSCLFSGAGKNAEE